MDGEPINISWIVLQVSPLNTPGRTSMNFQGGRYWSSWLFSSKTWLVKLAYRAGVDNYSK